MIIKSITEAFSMQPVTLSILGGMNRSPSLPELDIKEIRYEKDCDGNGHYRGYNFNGDILFSYLEKSVNVHYKISKA